jgi:predicted nucleic acid binding AN1-type Zn finger protein
MQLSIVTNYSLALKNDYMTIKATREQSDFYNECQWRGNYFSIRKQLNGKAICSLLFKINRLAASVGTRDRGAVTATIWY